MHKYRAVRTEKFGVKWPSKLQADVAEQLEWHKKKGNLVAYDHDVGFRVTSNTKYRVDFVCFWSSGVVTFLEAKGKDLALGKLKREQFEEKYLCKVDVVKKNESVPCG